MKTQFSFMFFTGLILIAISGAVQGQVSRYIDKGQSGLSVQLGADKTYGESGLSAQIGATYKGAIDVEFSYTKTGYESNRLELLEGDATSSLYEFRVNWWLFREQIHPSIDVNLSLWGEYAHAGFQNYLAADPIPYDYLNYNEGQFGFEMSVNFQLSEKWWLQPNMFAYYALGREEWTENALTVLNNYKGVGSALGVGAVRRIAKNSLYFQFNQYFDSYQDTDGKYKISMGYIFGL